MDVQNMLIHHYQQIDPLLIYISPKYVAKASDLIKISRVIECKPCARFSGET